METENNKMASKKEPARPVPRIPRVIPKAIIHPREKETDISGLEEKLDSEVEIVKVEVEDLTCAVCQSTYSDPRLLSCLHSFCKQCLSKLVGTSEVYGGKGSNLCSIKCPLCRNEHILYAKTGVDDLMPHTQLTSRLECLESPAPLPSCGECEEANVVSFCDNCQNYLCELCDQAHKRMASFKSHLLVPPDQAEMQPKAKAFQCPKHPSESLTVYCIKCKSVICRDCGLYDHNGHKFKPAVDVSDEIRKSFMSDSKQLEAKLKTFSSHAEEIGKVEKHVTVYPDEIKSFITSQFEEFHKLLDKRKEVLLQQVDTQYNGFSKTLWAEKDIVETGICKLEAGIRFAQQLAKSDDKLEVAVLGSKALASNQVTKALSWDPRTIENLGPLAYDADFDKHCIEKIGIIGNIEVVISDGEYYQYFGGENGTYCSEIEVKFGCHPKLSFPKMSFQCICRSGDEVVPCTARPEPKQNKWEVIFHPKYSGNYTIEVILKICGKDCHRKCKLLHVCIPEPEVPESKSSSSGDTFSSVYRSYSSRRSWYERNPPLRKARKKPEE